MSEMLKKSLHPKTAGSMNTYNLMKRVEENCQLAPDAPEMTWDDVYLTWK
jgi:hypothetical protein